MAEDRTDIQLRYGIRRSPSVAEDGELSECVNLVPTGNELVNLQPPLYTGIELPEGHRLVLVHASGGFRHYITLSGSSVYWTEKGKETPELITDISGTLKSVSAVGNTLCIFTDGQARYAVYRTDRYVPMDGQPPVPDISFKMRAQIKNDNGTARPSVTFDAFTPSSNPLAKGISLTANAAQAVRESLFAYFNPILSSQRKAGQFHRPFFVRYAYRMYDGSPFMLSSPVKMVLGDPVNLLAYVNLKKNGDGAYYQADFSKRAVLSGTLWYRLANRDAVSKAMAQWEDLITHIDIYVTPPLSYIDEDKSCTMLLEYDETDMVSGSVTNEIGAVASFGEKDAATKKEVFRKMTTREVHDYNMFHTVVSSSNGGLVTYFPTVQYPDNGERTLPFYRIYSIEIDKLEGEEKAVLPEDGVLDALATQPLLKADGQPSETLLPECSYVYNGRLHLANVHAVPRSCPFASLFPFVNGYSLLSSPTYKVPAMYKDAYVIIESDRRNVAVPLTVPETPDFRVDKGTFVFYPNPKAKYLVFASLTVETGENKAEYHVVGLSEHKALNGAYGYVGTPSAENIAWMTELINNADRSFRYTNKLYVSEANNPFTFNLEGVMSVGTGDITGMASATVALSQGQFGQFPLYVFSSDGIWSLSVGSTGMYSAAHPVSRDVCNNPSSITQIDSAVVFSTARGLKLLQGSEVTLLSAAMDGHNVDESRFNVEPEYSPLLVADTDRFTGMLASCRMIYDYALSLLHIYPETGNGKHYVYSLQSGEFATYVGYSPDAAVPDFPYPVVQIGTGLYSMEYHDSTDVRKGIVITRPVTFGDGLAMKMLCQLRLRHYRTDMRSRWRVAVFGSNDGTRYHRITSLRQVSVKYYRFVIYTEMTDVETLAGIAAVVDYRATGKLR